jgi:hypothetical protein
VISGINRLRGIERVIPSFAQDIPVLRYPKGTYDAKGRLQGQEPERITIRGVPQTATDEEMMKVDEGRRARGGIRIYTDVELRTVSVDGATQPDIVLWKGERWQVEQIDNWSDIGFHWKAIAVREGQ